MYYLIVSVLEPLPLLLLLLGAGLFLMRLASDSRPRLFSFVVLSYLALVVISLPLVAYFALGSLEWQHDPRKPIPTDRNAIVVLSGHLKEVYQESDMVLGDDSLYRCLKAIRLYQLGPPCPIIVSGGKVFESDPGPSLAEAMRDFLLEQGIPAEDIILESKSQSTYENAFNSAELIREHNIKAPIMVVTDAIHLPRSTLCFEQQGVEVIPVGCRYHPIDLKRGIRSVIPSVNALEDIRNVTHEWLGMAWYWLHGRI